MMSQQALEQKIDELVRQGRSEPNQISRRLGVPVARIVPILRSRRGRDHPPRLTLALRRIYGGLEALGVANDERWRILARIAADSVPSVRATLLRHVAHLAEPTRTDPIAEAVGMVKRTAERNLEDLALLGIVERTRDGDGKTSPIVWYPSDWLEDHLPTTTDKHPPSPNPFQRKGTTPPPKTPGEDARENDVRGPPSLSVEAGDSDDASTWNYS